MLDGSISGGASNVLVYATSNRRHMLPEYFSENLETRHVGEEVHPGESIEEKISLSERFGLWISFYPFGQDDYLAAVAGWLAHSAQTADNARDAHTHAGSAAVGAGAQPRNQCRVAWLCQFRRRTPLGALSAEIVRVAAAVLLRSAARCLAPWKKGLRRLLNSGRQARSHESPREALNRELREKLASSSARFAVAHPGIRVPTRMSNCTALFLLREGELVGHDGQTFEWQAPGRYTVAPLLPANTRILTALELPRSRDLHGRRRRRDVQAGGARWRWPR